MKVLNNFLQRRTDLWDRLACRGIWTPATTSWLALCVADEVVNAFEQMSDGDDPQLTLAALEKTGITLSNASRQLSQIATWEEVGSRFMIEGHCCSPAQSLEYLLEALRLVLDPLLEERRHNVVAVLQMKFDHRVSQSCIFIDFRTKDKQADEQIGVPMIAVEDVVPDSLKPEVDDEFPELPAIVYSSLFVTKDEEIKEATKALKLLEKFFYVSNERRQKLLDFFYEMSD